MSIKLECNVSTFRNLIDSISKIVSDVVFVFTPKGVKLQCMDSNHVGLIMLSLPKTTFKKYTCTKEEEIGMNLLSFIKILNCASSKDVCILTSSPTAPDVLLIEFSNESRSFEYEMKLMQLDFSAIEIPERDDDAVITFPSSALQNLIKDLSPLGAEIYIHADEKFISFSIESDTGKGTYKIEYKDTPQSGASGDTDDEDSSDGGEAITLQGTSVVCDEFTNAVTQLFSLKYLSTFSKACSFCPKVELRMADSQPLVIRFPLPRMSDNMIDSEDTGFGVLLFFLAPKIEDSSTN
jgi:proliferating cell nuclear antigen